MMDYLMLINHEHPIPSGFLPKRFAPVGDVILEAKVAEILNDLLEEFNGEIIAVSGYRCHLEQTQLYQGSLEANGAEFTAKYVARPGHSEHQTGLAVDLALNLPDIDPIRPHFPYTGICAAFRQKALNAGFIERYPKDKEHITKIAHEPWHFRYVGTPHAVKMQNMGVTLEEYLLH